MSAPRTSSTIGQHIDRHDWLTAKRKERDNLGWQGGQISAWLGEPGTRAETSTVFQQSLPLVQPMPGQRGQSYCAKPDYAALGLGTAADAEGRN